MFPNNLTQLISNKPQIASFDKKCIEVGDLNIKVDYFTEDNITELTIYKDKKCVGLVMLDGGKIRSTSFNEVFCGKGYGRLVYELLLEINGFVISDTQVSPMAYRVYNSLGRDYKLYKNPTIEKDRHFYSASVWCFVIVK